MCLHIRFIHVGRQVLYSTDSHGGGPGTHSGSPKLHRGSQGPHFKRKSKNTRKIYNRPASQHFIHSFIYLNKNKLNCYF